MNYAATALAAMMLVVPAVTVAQPAEQGTAAEEATANNQNRTICKTEKVTGSRMGSKKVCMTAAQWAQQERDQRQQTERTQAGRWKSE